MKNSEKEIFAIETIYRKTKILNNFLNGTKLTQADETELMGKTTATHLSIILIKMAMFQ